MVLDPTSPSLTVFKFKDSEKVLRDIQGLLEGHKGVLVTHRAAGGTDVSRAVNQARENTLDAISEVIEDATQTQIIPNKSTRA